MRTYEQPIVGFGWDFEKLPRFFLIEEWWKVVNVTCSLAVYEVWTLSIEI
jgi:hypothetical protein